jgi:serine/threonine-protein kinase
MILTEINQIDTDIQTYLVHTGEIFEIFDQQDSNCVSYGVEVDGQRWFVKESTCSRTVESLRRAVFLHSEIQHAALAHLYNAFKTPENGLALVFDWLPGEVLCNVPDFSHQEGCQNPQSPHARFRAFPTQKIVTALNTIYDLHRDLAAAGFIAVDFYDGASMYDFDAECTYVVDLDEYEFGAFNNPKDRMFGSSRFMAPEAFQRGACIDQITNVYT